MTSLRVCHLLAVACFSAGMSLPVGAQDAPAQDAPAQGGAWLDAQPVAAWNQQGAAVPKPTKIDGEPLASGRCASEVRPPEGPADTAVTTAGWTLVGPLQIFGDTSIVIGAVAADGMCRPLGYQAFLFVRGRFAGTLSPHPMNSRTDGMMNTVLLVSRDRVTATFARYEKDDPLCCPSRTTAVAYSVKRGAGGSTVLVESAQSAASPKP